MTYNLFEGAHQSYSQLVDFVISHNVDVLCLQEVNGWQDNDFAILKDFAEKCSFSYYAFGNSNTEFKLATLSRIPIVSQIVYTDSFWHCLIETTVKTDNKELAVYNLHLNPKWEGPRIKEAKKLLSLIDTGVPTLIAGDFNSISRQDNYSTSVFEELQSHGITKFGREELEYFTNDILESSGLIDAAAKLQNTSTTVPSGFNSDKNHEVPLRLDYVFVSPPLATAIDSVEVIKNATTDSISDHYPVLAILTI